MLHATEFRVVDSSLPLFHGARAAASLADEMAPTVDFRDRMVSFPQLIVDPCSCYPICFHFPIDDRFVHSRICMDQLYFRT